MSSHAFKKTSDTSLFYIHGGSYISQLFRFKFDFPNSLCCFPCIRVVLKVFGEGSDIYNLNLAPLLSYFAIWYNTYLWKKVPVFFTSFMDSIPRPINSIDAWPETQHCCLNYSFRSLLKSNMDQRSKGQASLLFSTARTLRFYPCLRHSATKERI